MTTRILFVGQGMFCDGLTLLLSESPGIEIVGSVGTCAEAREVVLQERPDVLIVDRVQLALNQGELNELLESVDSLKIISLTLSENKMVILDRHQFDDVTLQVLIQTLHPQRPGKLSEKQTA
jgi:DNA-binding NarL/FixJ family response regulator